MAVFEGFIACELVSETQTTTTGQRFPENDWKTNTPNIVICSSVNGSSTSNHGSLVMEFQKALYDAHCIPAALLILLSPTTQSLVAEQETSLLTKSLKDLYISFNWQSFKFTYKGK